MKSRRLYSEKEFNVSSITLTLVCYACLRTKKISGLSCTLRNLYLFGFESAYCVWNAACDDCDA